MKQIVSGCTQCITLIRTFLMIAITLLAINSCKKSDSGINAEPTKIFPTANDGSYWKLYYENAIFRDTVFQYEVDSVFVTSDTIGVNIVDTTGISPDTSRKIFSILKCYVFQKMYGQNDWINRGLMNYGVFRVDSEKRIRSIRSCNNGFSGGGVSYPSPLFFYETTVFDYNVKTGDSASIEQYDKTYRTKATVENFQFNGYLFKRQTFIGADIGTIKRTQLAGIFNTKTFATEVIPNVQYAPNVMLSKMIYYDNPSDSLELQPDFRFY